MNTITINGKTYKGNNSVIMNNGKVIVDGVDVTSDDKSKVINVVFSSDYTGDLTLKQCSNIQIKGDVKGNVTTSSGDIQCGNVDGSVNTSSGDVVCGNVSRDINTSSGDVKVKKVQGSVTTVSGDISKSLF